MAKEKAAKTEDILDAKTLEGESDQDGIETVNEDANGQVRIPGTEIKVVKPIIDFVKRHEATKAEHKLLTDRLINEKNEADVLYNKFNEYFVETEDGKMIYEAAGAQLIVTKPGELKYTTKLLPVEKPSGKVGKLGSKEE